MQNVILIKLQRAVREVSSENSFGRGELHTVHETHVPTQGRDGGKAGCIVKAVFLTSVRQVFTLLTSAFTLQTSLTVCCKASAKTPNSLSKNSTPPKQGVGWGSGSGSSMTVCVASFQPSEWVTTVSVWPKARNPNCHLWIKIRVLSTGYFRSCYCWTGCYLAVQWLRGDNIDGLRLDPKYQQCEPSLHLVLIICLNKRVP